MVNKVEQDRDRTSTDSFLCRMNGLTNGKKGFYDPVKDEFIEPDRTGFSYSFTADGHFEEAYYRAIANRTSCLS